MLPLSLWTTSKYNPSSGVVQFRFVGSNAGIASATMLALTPAEEVSFGMTGLAASNPSPVNPEDSTSGPSALLIVIPVVAVAVVLAGTAIALKVRKGGTRDTQQVSHSLNHQLLEQDIELTVGSH